MKTHENIVIAGHSMGTLFAVDAGIKCPSRIKALFLINPPLKVGIKAKMLPISLKLAFDRIPENDRYLQAQKAACSITPTKKLWDYLWWIPRYLELFRKIHKTKNAPQHLTVPGYAFHSGKDELVSQKSLKFLHSYSTLKTIHLKNSGHNYYVEEEKKILTETFEKMCRDLEELQIKRI